MRCSDFYDSTSAYAPQSLASSTAATTAYISAAAVGEIEFNVHMANLASGKTLKVEVFGATDSTGTGATSLGTKTFTVSSATPGYIARISVTPYPAYSHYALKITHTNGSATVVGVEVLTEPMYAPGDGAGLII